MEQNTPLLYTIMVTPSGDEIGRHGLHSGRVFPVTNLTLPGTNMEVENRPLEDHFPLQTSGFPLPC